MARSHRYEMLPHVHALLALVEQADAPDPPDPLRYPSPMSRLLRLLLTVLCLWAAVPTGSALALEVPGVDLAYTDGPSETLTGTPNHPFWVDAVQDYVPLGKLEVGTVLHVQGGGVP